jgi:hypothetical protein
MIGINQTPEEKKHQIIKVNSLAMREGEYFVDRVAVITQCLALGRAYCDSRWEQDTIYTRDKED